MFLQADIETDFEYICIIMNELYVITNFAYSYKGEG